MSQSIICVCLIAERDREPEAGDGRHGGEGSVSERREVARRSRGPRKLPNKSELGEEGGGCDVANYAFLCFQIQKMEHLSQQQFTVEGIDNSNARALVVKLINVVLTILQVVLLLTATAAGILMPFLKTR